MFNQHTMTPNLLYAYTDDFKLKAFAKTDENWTQELIIKDMGTGAEQVVRTYQTDTTAIKQILELTVFYFLNSNQLFYVGLYYPAEGQQGHLSLSDGYRRGGTALRGQCIFLHGAFR